MVSRKDSSIRKGCTCRLNRHCAVAGTCKNMKRNIALRLRSPQCIHCPLHDDAPHLFQLCIKWPHLCLLCVLPHKREKLSGAEKELRPMIRRRQEDDSSHSLQLQTSSMLK